MTEEAKPKPQFYECGCCGCYHPADWVGDCRDDANRFAAGELDEKYGGSGGWEEVDQPSGALYTELFGKPEAEPAIKSCFSRKYASQQLRPAEFKLQAYDEDTDEVSGPELPIHVEHELSGLRIYLGPHCLAQLPPGAPGELLCDTPDILIERKKDHWLIMIHPAETDPVCGVEIYANKAVVEDCGGVKLHEVIFRHADSNQEAPATGIGEQGKSDHDQGHESLPG